MIGYGMRDEEIFLFSLGMVSAAAVVGGIVAAIYRSRGRKLRVLEKALQSGQLAPQNEELLVAELTKPGLLGRMWAGGRLLVALGWLGVFIGIACLASGERDAEEVGIPFALLSFGVLTVPFALRELDHKRQAASRRP